MDGVLAVLTLITKGEQMVRTPHWESYLEGVVGVGLLLFLAFAFVIMAR